ncbi:carbon-nitrogen hydrolase family protein [Kitasatospora sp. NPDC085895]|uniref:carbon-nitrogen hydrolase family protein n=1 Tax=Kitasatospora sp. NPDC085895 TaxID=3155057 RepID=UPI00344D1C2E
MRNPLAVAVVQPVWAGPDVLANAERHAQAIEESEARLLVFPELSLTGYDLEAQPLAVDDSRLRPITEACRSTGAVALVGAPVRDPDGREYIATPAVTGEDTTPAYRKMHLHGPESDRFTPGAEPVVLTVDGWRLGLASATTPPFPSTPRTRQRSASTPMSPAPSTAPGPPLRPPRLPHA